MEKSTILQIGPLRPENQTFTGGMVAYLEGLLNTDLVLEYKFILLNTYIKSIFKKYRFLRYFLSIYFFFQLVFLYVKFRPKIAHIHISSGKENLGHLEKSILGIFCKRILRIKVILHWHSGNFDDFIMKSTYKKFIYRILNSVDKNIILSNKLYYELTKTLSKEKLVLIPNGINTSNYISFKRKRIKSDDKVLILFVGTINKNKGLWELGDAINLLVSEGVYKNIKLTIVGQEEYSGVLKSLKKFYEELGITDYIDFKGSLFGKEKIKVFNKSDIFVLPSWYESFGIVNLEAMAAGLPIISTKIGAIPDYIVEGENGFLINPGDSRKLAYYLSTLISDAEKRYQIGLRNMEKVKKEFDWKVVSSKISKLYISLLH